MEAGAVTGADYSAGRVLADLEKMGVVFAMVRVGTNLRKDFDMLGLAKAIGNDRIFETRSGCLETFRLQEHTNMGIAL